MHHKVAHKMQHTCFKADPTTDRARPEKHSRGALYGSGVWRAG